MDHGQKQEVEGAAAADRFAGDEDGDHRQVKKRKINGNSSRDYCQLDAKDIIRTIRKRHATRCQNRGLKALVQSESSATAAAAAAAESGSFFIPSEVMADILSRLPVKSLARFRCVCKQWNSLTYDPHFVKEHHKRALETGICVLMGRRFITARLFKFYPVGEIDEYLSYFDFPYKNGGKPLILTTYTLSNSVNGLASAFCEFYDDPFQYLLNPTTRELLQLPRGRHKILTESADSLGLGFDDSTGEYKLVRLCPKRDKSCFCEVLTVGNGEWRYVGDTPCYFKSQTPVFLNGALHWVADSYNHQQPVDTIVLAFDIKEEKFRFISIPPDCSNLTLLDVRELEGHVCLVKQPEQPQEHVPMIMRIWMLKGHANKEWKEEYNIDMSSWVNQTGAYYSHIVDIKDGKVLMQDRNIIYSYDLHRRTLHKLFDQVSCSMDVITESLISPRNLFSDL